MRFLSQSKSRSRTRGNQAPLGAWSTINTYKIERPEFFEGLEFVSENKLLRSSGLNGQSELGYLEVDFDSKIIKMG